MFNENMIAGWAKFNGMKWGCRAQQETVSISDGAVCEVLLFFNKKNKLFLPPLNPYHFMTFQPKTTAKQYIETKQWLEVADLLADQLLQHGLATDFWLPPEITDIRPFIWKGFKAQVRYTYYLDLPDAMGNLSKGLRNNIKKANKLAYISKRTNNMEEVHQCLVGTENRKKFSHQLSLKDLEEIRDLLGEDAFRSYVCYSQDGEPVSASITLLLNENSAMGWIAGTKNEHLRNGVAQQIQLFELEDLAAHGITHYDFAGANIPSVSEAKSYWGGELVPYYGLRAPSAKDFVRLGLDWFKLMK